MTGFDVICTNPSNKSSVKFCVDEVFEDRGGIDMRRMRRGNISSLGMPKAPQVNIQGDSSIQAWGCPGRHPIFIQQLSVCLGFCFVHMICVNSWCVMCLLFFL